MMIFILIFSAPEKQVKEKQGLQNCLIWIAGCVISETFFEQGGTLFSALDVGWCVQRRIQESEVKRQNTNGQLPMRKNLPSFDVGC